MPRDPSRHHRRSEVGIDEMGSPKFDRAQPEQHTRNRHAPPRQAPGRPHREQHRSPQRDRALLGNAKQGCDAGRADHQRQMQPDREHAEPHSQHRRPHRAGPPRDDSRPAEQQDRPAQQRQRLTRRPARRHWLPLEREVARQQPQHAQPDRADTDRQSVRIDQRSKARWRAVHIVSPPAPPRAYRDGCCANGGANAIPLPASVVSRSANVTPLLTIPISRS